MIRNIRCIITALQLTRLGRILHLVCTMEAIFPSVSHTLREPNRSILIARTWYSVRKICISKRDEPSWQGISFHDVVLDCLCKQPPPQPPLPCVSFYSLYLFSAVVHSVSTSLVPQWPKYGTTRATLQIGPQTKSDAVTQVITDNYRESGMLFLHSKEWTSEVNI